MQWGAAMVRDRLSNPLPDCLIVCLIAYVRATQHVRHASLQKAHTLGRLAVAMADRQLLELGLQHGVQPQLAPKQRSMTSFFAKAEPSAHNDAVAAEMAAGREQALVKRAA